tara:strand:+ start:2577 stop:4055 length:1479 start_codon:yes stop_codon:yes gene_type:complete
MITWQDVQKGIFSGESRGDYNALFGYTNRPEELFSDIKLTDMTLDEALEFSDPDGAYGTYVGLQNKGTVSTPMGAYQIVGATLRDAKEALGLSGDTKFSQATQDKIAKWILKTQGTDAWVGYKGPKVKGQNKMVAPNNNSMNVYSMFKDQMQPQAPQGIMGYLQDPRTRRALGTLSRTQVGARLAGLADKEIGENKITGSKNTTIRYLMSQKDGRPYAEAILAGADARATLKDYMVATGKTGGAANVRNQIELPNFAGFIVTLLDGTTYVETNTGERITDPVKAQEYIEAAKAGQIEYDKKRNLGKSEGTQEGKLNFTSAIEQAKGFAAKKVKWVDEVRDQYTNIDNTVLRYEQALDLVVNQGASSGRIAALLPTVSAQTQLLETVGKELGLDVIGSVTFGALSAPELKLALDLGLPSERLGPTELAEWLTSRIEAKKKAARALKDTAEYLSRGDTTVASYYSDYLNITAPDKSTTARPDVDPDNPLDLKFD